MSHLYKKSVHNLRNRPFAIFRQTYYHNQNILPDFKIFSAEFVRMWSIREDVLHVTRVGQVINCVKKNI